MSDFIQKLKNRLDSPLRPAKKAQSLMESSARKTLTSFQYKERKKTRIAAVLMLLYPYQDEDGNEKFDWKMPLVLRPPYEGVHNHGGQIGLPGGGEEQQDENLMMTAIRETQEEIGVIVPKVNILGSLSNLYIPPSDSMVTPFVGFLDTKPNFIPDPKEVARVIEAPLSSLQNPALRMQKEIILPNKIILDVPYFAVNEDSIWGATAMMLSEFLHLIEEID
ncbi:NTP pyrophosphohydrolase [Bernardetia litoralis DSM 6794]|uniref:NTP pyrophosphohydrolase n=1 Tax=Bernardetia litoralis (strain ATCC 23117 / DSM 6794 / NBRC 15988 / NCIMB 1366 / Fx l1 / Sio-4) TaxID=880071 RepID=I4AF41_BERLS|nr:CoA pyrophosphatase [Bernardetia litoralis]AFM02576.1 NTP pyrophosphohydrolase [Bernardetia litoralis DSM 6794]